MGGLSDYTVLRGWRDYPVSFETTLAAAYTISFILALFSGVVLISIFLLRKDNLWLSLNHNH